jgi:hypothetical protein
MTPQPKLVFQFSIYLHDVFGRIGMLENPDLQRVFESMLNKINIKPIAQKHC